ncbi:WD40/YVTN/BNR-like repeat-containing protein [Paraburkholderia sp. RL17-337-BIB-A]|uniref:WD40/YVTN/BNR-like repeat-containing protein n=1 Tax=Paraburkholderia sp. RL17-337-BIB-A TaxID=3031636 RepID=UPI0038BA62B9
MNPRLYIGTGGLSVWYSDDRGDTLKRLLSDTGMYSESRIWALSTHPERPNHMLAGTDSGIYRLDLREGKFVHLPSPMDNMAIWSIAQAPDDADTILVGTRPATVFRSTDSGATWQKMNAGFPESCKFVLRPRITKLQFSATVPGLVWAGVEIAGVWVSRDGGENWQRSSEGIRSDDIHDVTSVVRDGVETVFATTDLGLHVSHDLGHSWRFVEIDSPSQYTRKLFARADDSGVLFLTNGDGPPGSWGRLLRSVDFGKTWQDARLPGEVASTVYSVATHPADPKLIFVASALGQVFRSADGGDSWSQIPRRLGETRSLMWVPV